MLNYVKPYYTKWQGGDMYSPPIYKESTLSLTILSIHHVVPDQGLGIIPQKAQLYITPTVYVGVQRVDHSTVGLQCFI